jgi:hypothetical protein
MKAWPGLKFSYPEGLVCNFNSAAGLIMVDNSYAMLPAISKPVYATGKELCLVKLDQGWEVSESAMSSVLATPGFDFTK